MNINKLPPLETPLKTYRAEEGRSSRRFAAAGERVAQEAPAGDRAELSPDARLVAELLARMPEASEVRADLVAALRADLARGEYRLDPEEIAGGLLKALSKPAGV